MILLLLDLSAAFDRTQFVNINGSTSKRRVLQFGVPQGLVLGPLLFSLYTSPLSDIASKHELSFHVYADDRHLYVTFEASSLNDMELNKCRLEACVLEIDPCILLNKLKLNKDKTELLVISSVHGARPALSDIHVCDERVLSSSTAGNIGVLFDESLNTVPQVTAMCKSALARILSSP